MRWYKKLAFLVIIIFIINVTVQDFSKHICIMRKNRPKIYCCTLHLQKVMEHVHRVVGCVS